MKVVYESENTKSCNKYIRGDPKRLRGTTGPTLKFRVEMNKPHPGGRLGQKSRCFTSVVMKGGP